MKKTSLHSLAKLTHLLTKGDFELKFENEISKYLLVTAKILLTNKRKRRLCEVASGQWSQLDKSTEQHDWMNVVINCENSRSSLGQLLEFKTLPIHQNEANDPQQRYLNHFLSN
ncbi:hypothetical protein T11_12526 [Trichinella zimbabwensis]|uniref:Uncharacterized protein n=1 Tax=Trichinella zimbabwensis TaxID=268475 RepID=A0A0V1H8Y1_9BILA|nr:hypothetical protein T11_12526 [Trichinella zimbabwensis]